MPNANERVESLGPAEKIIDSITKHIDHIHHGRPGVVFDDARCVGGARWEAATWVQEGEEKVVYLVKKVGKRQTKTRIGVGEPGTVNVKHGNRVICRWQEPGIFPEIAAYLYRQIADVWKMDNEFAAKWASYAYKNESNRDLKAVLASFMLVQNRFGDSIKDGDEKFFDEDYRSVGEAMLLLRDKDLGDVFNPKMLLRVSQILEVPQIAEINRGLGFGRSARRAATGRYHLALKKWLQHMELNTKSLETLVKVGFRRTIQKIAQRVGYKPETERFFEVLRWSQKQSRDGHRSVSVGVQYKTADDQKWEGLTEEQICRRIVADKLSYKVIVGKLPSEVGITPAIMAAAVESGSLSSQDLIILTPTLEELGLLTDGEIYDRWKKATQEAENQRALNIAKNVRTDKAKEALEEAADVAVSKAVEEVARDIRVYVLVDISGSMDGAIDKAKEYVSKFVGAIPLDRLHVAVFNTVGREVKITRASAAAVRHAFAGFRAGGGTCYATGTAALISKYKPKENEDALFIYVGDEGHYGKSLHNVFGHFGVTPAAFGRLYVPAVGRWGRRPDGHQPTFLKDTASSLGIPCFDIDEKIFDDAYAVPRTIRNLIASTPVTQAGSNATYTPRVSLVETILNTELLQKPVWA